MKKSPIVLGMLRRGLSLPFLLLCLFFSGNHFCLGQNDLPVASVAATKMNVLYIGVDNPLKVAVTEYKASDLNVSITNGTITGANGKYIANPVTQGTAIIRIDVHNQVVASCEFRVKLIPTPVAKVAGLRSGAIMKDNLLKTDKVAVEIENFDFDVACKVTGFKMSAQVTVPEGKEKKDESYQTDVELASASDVITPEQKELIKKLAPGSKVYFEEIKASLPDGTIREIGSVILKLE